MAEIKYAGENSITTLIQLIKTALLGKVNTAQGKGLSTNDYTTEEKSKLAGLSNYTLPTASSDTLGGVKVGAGLAINSGVISATGGGVADSVDWSNVQNKPDFAPLTHTHAAAQITGLSIPAISTSIETDAASDTKTTSPKAVKAYVDGKLGAVYKPQGSLAFASLPALSASILGNVYNVTDAFNSTADFLEGAGKAHRAGTNVVCVSSGSSYKWDALSGSVDLSGYVETSELAEFTSSEITTLWNSVA